MSLHRITLNAVRESEEESLLDIVDAIDSAKALAFAATNASFTVTERETREGIATVLDLLVGSLEDISTRAYKLHHKRRPA